MKRKIGGARAVGALVVAASLFAGAGVADAAPKKKEESFGQAPAEMVSIAKEFMKADGNLDSNEALNYASALGSLAGIGLGAVDANKTEDLVQSGIKCGMNTVELGIAVAPVALAAATGGVAGAAGGGTVGGGAGALFAGAGAIPGAGVGAAAAGAAGALAAGTAALGPAMPGIMKGGKGALGSCTTFAGHGLGVAGYMVSEYRNNEDLPQAIDFISKIDPNSKSGRKINSQLTAVGEGVSPEMREAALTSAVGVAKEMDKIDYGGLLMKAGDVLVETGGKIEGSDASDAEGILGALTGDSTSVLGSFLGGDSGDMASLLGQSGEGSKSSSKSSSSSDKDKGKSGKSTKTSSSKSSGKSTKTSSSKSSPSSSGKGDSGERSNNGRGSADNPDPLDLGEALRIDPLGSGL